MRGTSTAPCAPQLPPVSLNSPLSPSIAPLCPSTIQSLEGCLCLWQGHCYRSRTDKLERYFKPDWLMSNQIPTQPADLQAIKVACNHVKGPQPEQSCCSVHLQCICSQLCCAQVEATRCSLAIGALCSSAPLYVPCPLPCICNRG